MGQLMMPGIDSEPEDRGIEPAAIYAKYPRKRSRAEGIREIEKAIVRVAKKRKITRAAASEHVNERTEDYASSPEIAALKKLGDVGERRIPYAATWYRNDRFNDPREAWGYKRPRPAQQYVAPEDVQRRLWMDEGRALVQSFRSRRSTDEQETIRKTARRWWRRRGDWADDEANAWADELGINKLKGDTK